MVEHGVEALTVDMNTSDCPLEVKKRPAPQKSLSETPAKRLREEETLRASFEEELKSMNDWRRKRSRKTKQRGRKKGSKNKISRKLTQKLGDANLLFAHDRFEEAIVLLEEVICFKQNLSDPYHTLGLIYTAMGDKKKALNFYILAAIANPKDVSLWKLLVTRSIEQGDKMQATSFLEKAIKADPEDIGLRFHCALLYVELRQYQKAADSYERISRLHPDNIEVLEKATQLYQKCGQRERAVCMLEDSLRNHVNVANLVVVDLLVSVLMESNEYARALEHIERTQQVCGTGKGSPLYLTVKAGICHVHLGHLEKAEAHFNILKLENASTNPELIIDAADSLVYGEHYDSALKYYMMLEENAEKYNGYLLLKIARCYASLRKRALAIEYYYKAVEKLEHCVDARLMLASLLLEEDRDEEAISVLSPPAAPESALDATSDADKLWWCSGRIKLKISQIYKAKGSIEAFVDVLLPVIREALSVETQKKVKPRRRKRLSTNVLSKRVKVLEYHQPDNVFHGFRPVASSKELSIASRAQKLLLRREAEKKARRAAALAAGIDWESDGSDDESPQVFREPPLPDFLKEKGNHLLILDLCKSLSSLQRFRDALVIIMLSLKLECNTLSVQMKEEFRTLGAQVESNIADPAREWDNMQYIVRQRPYSFPVWNCYYKGILRAIFQRNESDTPSQGYRVVSEFLRSMRLEHKDSVPPIVISAHKSTLNGHHQAAARQYLEAHKLMPDNPLINLCVGTALINLAIDHRLQNKHQTVLQGLAFLYNSSRLCGGSQEALYNIARECHHVGLVSLAVTYYEKVLAIREKDYPIPVLPIENSDLMRIKKSGYCDLRREAAYNLHLIYKKSGACDLARQVLKDHVVL